MSSISATPTKAPYHNFLIPTVTAEPSRQFCLGCGHTISEEQINKCLEQASKFFETPDLPFNVLAQNNTDTLKTFYVVCEKIEGVVSIVIHLEKLSNIPETAFEAFACKVAPYCISLTVKDAPLSDRIFKIFAQHSSRLIDLELWEDEKDKTNIEVSTLQKFATPTLKSLSLNLNWSSKEPKTILAPFGAKDIFLEKIELNSNLEDTTPSFGRLIKDSLRQIILWGGKRKPSLNADLALALKQKGLKSVELCDVPISRANYERLSSLVDVTCSLIECYTPEGELYPDVETNPRKKQRTLPPPSSASAESMAGGGGGGGTA